MRIQAAPQSLVKAIALAAIISICTGCDGNRRSDSQQQTTESAVDVVQEISLSGFDPEGEPSIRVMSDGSLYVVVQYMPPSWAPEDQYTATDLGPFRDFDVQMERAVGVDVHWDDREFFLIREPKDDTIERIREFFAGYPRQ